MKLPARIFLGVWGMLSAAVLADEQAAPGTRYGLFQGLDHRSWYSQGDFPEPFLVDDTGLEINEARLDWLHTQANARQNDHVAVEVEKGFGLMTLELKVPFQRDSAPGRLSQGIGNIEAGVRHPFYQFVSASGFFDSTLGAGLEAGLPVNSAVSKSAELVPKLFNDLKVGEHFTLQSLFGYSAILGRSTDGGLQTFEYGFVSGYSLARPQFSLPGVQKLMPMFELKGETELNKDHPGRNSLLANAGFRINLTAIGRVQPRLGLGYVFPLNSDARADVHWGLVTSLVFEY